MRLRVLLCLLFAVPSWGQTATTGSAETKGPCSPAITGSNNQLTIKCQGIPDKLGTQLVDLLNRIAKNQTDAETMITKLDACLKGVKEVREQQLDWRLDDSQRASLMALLAKAPKARVSIHAINDRNAGLFAGDLWATFKAAGWDVGANGWTTDFTINQAIRGVQIAISRSEFLPAATEIQGALSQVTGTKPNIHTETVPSGGPDAIFLAVGAKPLSE